jgi:NTP pyrophosphatase (non-canonical NTP hydrolase)
MTLEEYQKKAMTTCMPSSENFSYMFLNLVGEVGEFASKVAKHIRKGHYSIMDSNIANGNNIDDLSEPQVALDELKKEAGDVLWQLSGLCSIMNWRLEDVAKLNLDKLASRKARDVIDGDGDNR